MKTYTPIKADPGWDLYYFLEPEAENSEAEWTVDPIVAWLIEDEKDADDLHCVSLQPLTLEPEREATNGLDFYHEAIRRPDGKFYDSSGTTHKTLEDLTAVYIIRNQRAKVQ
jgi:hypothetical protein